MDNLLRKASILLTPTAFESGRMLAIKPSEDLFGSEEVTNGDFSTDSDWTKSSGTTISGGIASIVVTSGGYQSLAQSVTYVSGKSYTLKATVNGTLGKACTFFDAAGNNGGLSVSNGTVTFNGEEQVLDITFVANGNSNTILIARNGSGNYSFSIDKVSVKEDLSGDFNFTRNSEATIDNEEGLIQNVQIIGSEEVTNGNFSQEGAEEITNGNFSTDSNWTKGAGWSISGGSASCDGTNSPLDQSSATTVGKSYKVSVTVSNMTTASVNIRLGISSGDIIGSITANGTYTFYGTVASNTTFRIRSAEGFDGSIDNVSVKEIGQDWAASAGVTIEDDVCKFISTGSGGTLTSTTAPLISGKQYKVKFEITYQDGNSKVKINNSGASGVFKDNVNLYEEVFTCTSTSYLQLYFTNAGSCFIDNVSVKEFADDTNLPRITYENDAGAFLLEPQSTNLVTYSEAFNNWIKTTTTVDSNIEVSPNGETSASRLNFSAVNSFIRLITLSGDPNGKSFTNSIYLKSDTSNSVKIGILGSGAGLGFITETLTLTNEWQRFDISQSFSSSGDNVRFRILATEVGSIFAWAAQTEEQSFATSYIPTFGAARTRLRDLATNSGNATLINSTEGVLYFEASILDDSDSNKYISLSDGTNSNIVQVDFDYSSSRLQYVVKSSSATVVNIKIPYTGTNMDKFAMKWKENDFAIWRNGIEIGADATGVAPLGLKVLKLTHPNVGSSNHFFGKIKALAVYKEALTDEELQYLTTQ